MIAERIEAARRGRRVWLDLLRSHDLAGGRYVVLMLEDDPELNAAALRRLEVLGAARGGVLVVTDRPEIAAVPLPSGNEVRRVSSAQADDLLSYYELYEFTDRLLIVSLTRPSGRRLDTMRSVDGLTLDDLVCSGMYGVA